MKRCISLVSAFLLLAVLFLPLMVPCSAHAETLPSVVLTADDSDSGGSWWDGLLGWVKGIFVPSDDYFMRKNSELGKKLNEKMGGIAELYQYVTAFFGAFQTASPPTLSFAVPGSEHIPEAKDFKVDLFGPLSGLLGMIRPVLTVGFCVFTAIVGYHKIRVLFDR